MSETNTNSLAVHRIERKFVTLPVCLIHHPHHEQVLIAVALLLGVPSWHCLME